LTCNPSLSIAPTATKGDNVVCFDKDEKMLEQLKKDQRAVGERLAAMAVDVTDINAVAAGVDIAVAK
jgi:predicted RNA methylase